MKPNTKKCKGTGKAKGYGCGKEEMQRTYGLGHSCKCYPRWLYNSDAGKEKLNKAILKATKPRKDIEQAIKEKNERASLQYLKTNTTAIVHQYIRQRDKGLPCISCGTLWHLDFQAGHFFKAELYSSLKYNEFNINGQCPQCNLRKEGNLNQYELNLPNRIGSKNFEALKEMARNDKKTNFKWDREELKQIRANFKAKLKALNK